MRTPRAIFFPISNGECLSLVSLLSQTAILSFLGQNVRKLGADVNTPLETAVRQVNWEESKARVVSIQSTERVAQAFTVMASKDVSGLAVLDEYAMLAGTLGIRDVRVRLEAPFDAAPLTRARHRASSPMTSSISRACRLASASSSTLSARSPSWYTFSPLYLLALLTWRRAGAPPRHLGPQERLHGDPHPEARLNVRSPVRRPCFERWRASNPAAVFLSLTSMALPSAFWAPWMCSARS